VVHLIRVTIGLCTRISKKTSYFQSKRKKPSGKSVPHFFISTGILLQVVMYGGIHDAFTEKRIPDIPAAFFITHMGIHEK